MKAFALMATFLISSVAFAAPKVTLMIYVDMSLSMSAHRRALASMTEVITSQLKERCGDFEVGVSNLTYLRSLGQHLGGELIQAGSEFPILNSQMNLNFVRYELSRRIRYDNVKAEREGLKVYEHASHEKTYTSVLETLGGHLKYSEQGPSGSSPIGVLILTDAAPFFEAMQPKVAFNSLKAQFPNREIMAGALGAHKRCSDIPYKPTSPKYQANSHKMNWLRDFSMESGYHWDMCLKEGDKDSSSRIQFEQSVEDFMIMLMEKAQCQLLV